MSLEVKIAFDMPYQLGVDGTFAAQVDGENLQLELVTHLENTPKFPGADIVENVAIVHDDTNVLGHTKVTARYIPTDQSLVADPRQYSNHVSNFSLSIANALVTGVRVAFNDYMKDYLHHAKRLGPISINVTGTDGEKGYFCYTDAMMGGITFASPPRRGPNTTEFARVLASGPSISVSKTLYFDAQRYKTHGDRRMALANLVMSFEIGLADSLARVARAQGNTALEADILEATIGRLGNTFAKQTLGESFDKEDYWGARLKAAYEWLRNTRNKVLHRAQMSVTFGAETRDFNDIGELEKFFAELDWFNSEIDKAVANVLVGKPAKSREST